MKNIWIIGCGDIGHRVFKRIARLYQNQHPRTSAFVRTQQSSIQCQQLGMTATVYDLDNPQPLNKADFEGAEIFYFAPPPKTGNTDTRIHNFLNQIENAPRKVVLISTTGVYGDCQGQWIDESQPLNPQTDRAKRRVAAEQALTKWASRYNKPYVILRVPGIYALERLPRARSARTQTIW